MGVDILWLMPIHSVGVKNHKGTLGSYYSVKDYKSINSEFGTLNDFKELVNKAHQSGMYIIIDWVANHSAWDNGLTKEHPEWYLKDKTGNFAPPVGTDWTDVIGFDYSKVELRKYMTGAMKYWLTETNIDGFRCDVAGMVPKDFWASAIPELRKVKPIFMLAEASEPELHTAGFNMTYGWELHHIMNQIAKGKKNCKHIDGYFEKANKIYSKDDLIMYFTSNHDENAWNGTEYDRMGEGAMAFAVLCSTIPGMPLIYTGQEVSNKKELAFFEKDPVDWKKGNNLSEFYQKLLALKKENKALWNGLEGGELIKVKTSNDLAVYAFYREKDKNRIFVVLNLTGKEQEVSFEDKNLKDKYIEVFSGDKIKISKKDDFSLKPWEYKVFKKI
jgi:alpha-amylase